MSNDPDFAKMRSAMIDSQLRPNTVTSDEVVAAFRAVKREDFVPRDMRAFAYLDEDMEVGAGRYMMEPLTLGRLLDRAAVKPGDRTLLIGDPTGYTAALLAEMGARVHLREREGDVLSPALGKYDVGREPDDKAGNYDLVFIEGLAENVPQSLIARVEEGGRIAAVILEHGSPRAAIGRVFGGHIGWNSFADAYVAALPEFAKAREFTF